MEARCLPRLEDQSNGHSFLGGNFESDKRATRLPKRMRRLLAPSSVLPAVSRRKEVCLEVGVA